MKKLLLFFFSVALVTGAATAQTTPRQEEKKDLRETIKDKRIHQKAAAKSTVDLKLGTAHDQHVAAVAARRKQHAIAKDLREKGEVRPVVKAKKAIHKQHEAAEDKKAGIPVKH